MNEPVLYDRGQKVMKTICQRCSGWVSVLDRSLHRQTAVNVRFTDGKLKPLSSSEPSSNPPDYFNKNPHFTLKNMGAALFVCLWLWCFNVLIYYAPSVWKALQAITWKMESNSNRYFLFYFFFPRRRPQSFKAPFMPGSLRWRLFMREPLHFSTW